MASVIFNVGPVKRYGKKKMKNICSPQTHKSVASVEFNSRAKKGKIFHIKLWILFQTKVQKEEKFVSNGRKVILFYTD